MAVPGARTNCMLTIPCKTIGRLSRRSLTLLPCKKLAGCRCAAPRVASWCTKSARSRVILFGSGCSIPLPGRGRSCRHCSSAGSGPSSACLWSPQASAAIIINWWLPGGWNTTSTCRAPKFMIRERSAGAPRVKNSTISRAMSARKCEHRRRFAMASYTICDSIKSCPRSEPRYIPPASAVDFTAKFEF